MAEILLQQGIAGGENEQEEDQRAYRVLGQPGHRRRTGVGQGEGGEGSRQDGAPRHLDPARITPGGVGGPEDTGEFVGTEQGGRRSTGLSGEQCGNLDQAATADDGVDQTGNESGQDQPAERRNDFHRCLRTDRWSDKGE